MPTGVVNPSRYGYNYCLLECVLSDYGAYLGEGYGTGEWKGHRKGGRDQERDRYGEGEGQGEGEGLIFYVVFCRLEECNLWLTFRQYLV